MDTSNVKVGFIGAGNMAYAIGKALVSSGVVKAENMIASARTRTRLDTCWKVLRNLNLILFFFIYTLEVLPFWTQQ